MEQVNSILDRAKILVRVPGDPSGNQAGVGASIGVFGKAYSFEGFVYDSNGQKKYTVGLPNVGVYRPEISGKRNGTSDYEEKLSLTFDYFRGGGFGVEITKDNVKFKIGVGINKNGVPGLPGDPEGTLYFFVETDAAHQIPIDVRNKLLEKAATVISELNEELR